MNTTRHGADTVVQMVGGFGAYGVKDRCCRSWRGPAPGLVGSPATRDTLLSDATMAVVAESENLALALVGIGTLDPSPLLPAAANAVNVDEQARLLAEGCRRGCLLPVLHRSR